MGKSVLRKVVVDVREFMSPLPAVLHQQALDVIPVTLEVGPPAPPHDNSHRSIFLFACDQQPAPWFLHSVLGDGIARASEKDLCRGSNTTTRPRLLRRCRERLHQADSIRLN